MTFKATQVHLRRRRRRRRRRHRQGPVANQRHAQACGPWSNSRTFQRRRRSRCVGSCLRCTLARARRTARRARLECLEVSIASVMCAHANVSPVLQANQSNCLWLADVDGHCQRASGLVRWVGNPTGLRLGGPNRRVSNRLVFSGSTELAVPRQRQSD